MELRYQFMIIIGFVVLTVLIFFKFKKNEEYKGGKKIANSILSMENSYFRRRIVVYRILSFMLIAACGIALITSCFIMARPYKKIVENKEIYNRDIILCMDISTSVNELNKNLVKELKDTVEDLKGERFGIVIFNTSPVMLTPLTDDYEYILDILSQIEKSLKFAINSDTNFPDNWMYLQNYITEGTLIGAEERGSSLIGDGLASSVYDFSDIDKERTRIVIFSSDNDIQGTPYVTLSEAADICKKNNVVVYGIGTSEMDDDCMKEMKAAVTKTGGRFYLEGQSGNTRDIVDKINKADKNIVKGEKEVKTVEIVTVPFILLVTFIGIMIVLTKITKK